MRIPKAALAAIFLAALSGCSKATSLEETIEIMRSAAQDGNFKKFAEHVDHQKIREHARIKLLQGKRGELRSEEKQFVDLILARRLSPEALSDQIFKGGPMLEVPGFIKPDPNRALIYRVEMQGTDKALAHPSWADGKPMYPGSDLPHRFERSGGKWKLVRLGAT